jgi:hypothetical protein
MGAIPGVSPGRRMRRIMYLPRIVAGTDTGQPRRCKFENRALACLLVPPGACSLSCRDTRGVEGPLVLRPSGARAVQVAKA